MLNYKIPALEKVIYSTSLEIRISNINYGNHLGHDALVSLLHEARVRFLRSLGFTEANIGGFGILLTNLVVNYRSEAFYADQLTIHLALGEFRKTGFELLYQVEKGDAKLEVARALTTLTFYDYHLKKVEQIPQVFVAALGGD